jgi:hypothetical protein
MFGWDAAFPADCDACRQGDGSGIMNIVNYLHVRYPKDRIGLIMSIHDQVFRLFYSAGEGTDSTQPQDCDSNDPNILAGLGLQTGDPPRYPGPLWEEGLDSLRTYYDCTNAFSSYYIGSYSGIMDGVNPIDTLHMHIFRDRFYTQLVQGMTPAQWAADLVSGKMDEVGP